jgi:hypothetical protein
MDGRHGNILLVMMLALHTEHCNVSADNSGKIYPGKISLPAHLQCIDPLQIFAQTFSGLSALLSESTFAEAKKQRTSTMIRAR